jgi:hypothetical protein
MHDRRDMRNHKRAPQNKTNQQPNTLSEVDPEAAARVEGGWGDACIGLWISADELPCELTPRPFPSWDLG